MNLSAGFGSLPTFFPSPAGLAFRKEGVKVTPALSNANSCSGQGRLFHKAAVKFYYHVSSIEVTRDGRFFRVTDLH